MKKLVYRWFPTLATFFSMASQVSRSYDANDTGQIAMAIPADKNKPNKLTFMWLAYGKKLTHGVVYVICGFVILVTLAVFLHLVATKPEMVAETKTTFVVETIALVFFGIAWMTASQLAYLKQIEDWLQTIFKKNDTNLKTDTA